jgi:hypothetical protein
MKELWRLAELVRAQLELVAALESGEPTRVEKVCNRYAHLPEALSEITLEHLEMRARGDIWDTIVQWDLDTITYAILREEGIGQIIYSFPPSLRARLKWFALVQYAVAYPPYAYFEPEEAPQNEEELDDAELERFELTLGDGPSLVWKVISLSEEVEDNESDE